MNKDELLKEVAKKAGVPQKTAYDVVNSILDIVEKTVSKGKKVTLIGFGTFDARNAAQEPVETHKPVLKLKFLQKQFQHSQQVKNSKIW